MPTIKKYPTERQRRGPLYGNPVAFEIGAGQRIQLENLRARAREIWSKLDDSALLPLPSIRIGRTEPGHSAEYRADRDEIIIHPDYADRSGTLEHELAHACQLKSDGWSDYAADGSHGARFHEVHDQVREVAGLPARNPAPARIQQPSTASRMTAPPEMTRVNSQQLAPRPFKRGTRNWKGHGFIDCGGIDCEMHNVSNAAELRRLMASGVVTR